ncbi:hypothetical protein J4212_05770 [Candidatus Woesearchaeota archaeon]|nr:hypothetical protein [Candidatus Woesearchaeota archaeon]
MDMVEIQKIIKKRITVIKTTIVRPLGFDVVVAVPKHRNGVSGSKPLDKKNGG